MNVCPALCCCVYRCLVYLLVPAFTVDAAYTFFYSAADYPVTKILREPVYVEVELLEKTDPNLVLTLGRCWTTTTPNPHSLPQWDILVNG